MSNEFHHRTSLNICASVTYEMPLKIRFSLTYNDLESPSSHSEFCQFISEKGMRLSFPKHTVLWILVLPFISCALW